MLGVLKQNKQKIFQHILYIDFQLNMNNGFYEKCAVWAYLPLCDKEQEYISMKFGNGIYDPWMMKPNNFDDLPDFPSLSCCYSVCSLRPAVECRMA